MNFAWRDLRFGVRMLIKHPSFTIVAVIVLAIGIGSNTAIFSTINAVLLRHLPFKAPDRIVMIYGSNIGKGLPKAEITPADFIDFKNQNNSFEQLAALRYRDFTITGADDPEIIRGAIVSANFFPVLGVNPGRGRAFLPDEDRPGKDRVAIISHGLWGRRFGSDPNILEKSITLNGESYTIAGVLPPEFQFPGPTEQVSSTDLWAPLGLTDQERGNRNNHVLLSIGRLKNGVTVEQARAEMTIIASRLEQQYPQSNTGWSVTQVSMPEQVVGKARSLLLLLLVAIVVVLLIACANIANLMLGRGVARQKELAIRAALGASSSRIVGQLLTESVLLALVGGVLGVLLAWASIEALLRISPDYIPRANEITIDGWALGFTFLVSLLTGVIFGLAPAIQASKPELVSVLKEGTRGSTGGGSRRMRAALVIVEVALSVVLLISAGLLIRSFAKLLSVNPGFTPDNVLSMEISLPRSRYGQPTQRATFYQQLLARVGSLPGVEFAGATNHLPMGGTNSSLSFVVEGRPPTPGEALPTTNWRAVSPNYFATMRIPLLKGRWFSEADKDGAPAVVIISETMANRFWKGIDPIGQRIRLGSAQEDPMATIAGVVGDVKHWGLDAEVKAQMYLSYLQEPPSRMHFLVRTASNTTSLASALRSEVFAVDRNQPITNIRTMEEVLANSVLRKRFTMLLLTIFAGVALVLTAVGIYGVISHSVSQRTHEIGIRLALGAQPRDILKLMLGHGLRLALVGVVIGLIAAFAVTRLMSTLLFGIGTNDLATFIGVPIGLMIVVLIAISIPSRRATRVDPVVALRAE